MISRRAVRKMIGELEIHGPGAQTLVHGEPVHVGHHDVEEHEVGDVEGGRANGLFAVRGRAHVVAGDLQRLGDEPADIRLVVHDQDAFGHQLTLQLRRRRRVLAGPLHLAHEALHRRAP